MANGMKETTRLKTLRRKPAHVANGIRSALTLDITACRRRAVAEWCDVGSSAEEEKVRRSGVGGWYCEKKETCSVGGCRVEIFVYHTVYRMLHWCVQASCCLKRLRFSCSGASRKMSIRRSA